MLATVAAAGVGLAVAAGAGCEDRDARPDAAELRSATPSSQTFRRAVDAVLPAVVYVEVEPTMPRGRRALPFPIPPGETPPGDPGIDAGSGVIFSSDGYILTSNHVVRDAGRVRVTLHDRRQFDARVLARDPSTDVAIVQIEAEELPTASFGDSDGLQTGDWVLAVGSPLGLLFTATAGIVSATGRQVGIIGTGGDVGALEVAPLEYFIQTDAAINPGNSGGPLIDLGGRVVGVNTAIVSPTGVFAGIGFAVPIDLARSVARDLIEFGEVRRPFLGVVLEDVDAADVDVYDLPSMAGAEIVSVQPESPAAEAGLEVGDVVVALDGEEIQNVGDLQAALAGLEPGTEAVLDVIRAGRRVRIPLELGLV
ncbi:MAG: S1C family serine protease, partial [Gemmatimonadota bacterium]